MYVIAGQAAFRDGDKLYICMDFANGGELWYHMYRNKECPLYHKHTAGSAILAGFYCAEVRWGKG